MARQNCKWNISKSQGHKIVYNILISILTDNKKIIIKDLKDLLLIRTQSINILYNNKPKNICYYLQDIYGGLIQFIDNLDDINLLYKNNKIFAILNNDEYFEDWCFI